MPSHRIVSCRARIALALAILSLASGALAQQGGTPPPPAVTVVTVESSDVTLTRLLPGRVSASAMAEVRPQVNGLITERLFEEGRPVEEGSPLYRIDAASYAAQEAAANASLAQAQAQMQQAEREVERMKTLLERRVTSQQEYDDAVAARDVAAAAVKVAEANLLASEIDLDRATIRAPISGIAGLSEATKGALVTAGQATPLTVIRTIDPVNVDVTQSSAEMLRWRRASGTIAAGGPGDTVLTLKLADGSTYEHTGRLSAAEPHVNQQTGVILLRLEFPNPEQLLLPGMYVQVEVPQAVVANAVLVPQEGVTRDRRGRPMAMIVTSDNVVEARQITIERDRGNQWVVTEGLDSGDRVIVAGLQKIAPGQQVSPEERVDAETGDAGQPGAGQPAAGQSEAAQPAADQAEAGQADATQPADGQTDAAQADAAQAGAAQPADGQAQDDPANDATVATD
ncbi:efflux RND transporter periplasmic adaptor subunit [Tropicimonas isoalkanivorans]|uniref:Membrane fusion protein, multidrug efflux system n=1 Tax=Tropicimonas isoalkanivorans TaxID=441112 RepID=A0A1I1KB98_9RHOB|nr:efflux RND transporter periplasmic adaptor subunit [Tropicimonas isoalkanivorans]SFC58149.1 membrane fusion protein, multidrug efflux system [Tropicimonas isoalkanivorans]